VANPNRSRGKPNHPTRQGIASRTLLALLAGASLVGCVEFVEHADPSSETADAGAVEVARTDSALVATGSKTFVAFESGPVRPIALSTDGLSLFAVNTPDNSLEIFSVAANGNLTKKATVPVGLEPVAVAARNSNEVWVVNHLSDSVSVVDVSVTPPRVSRTLLVGDEPRDIVFAGAGNSRAFVTTAHRGQHRTNASISGVTGAGDPQLTTSGVGRADVWVFDPTNLGTTLGATPLKIITLFGDTPRALAVSPDKSTVYAAVLKSGNRTTSLISDVVCVGFGSTPCTISGNSYPAGLPGPSDNYAHKAAPHTGNIVRFNVSNNKWEDQLGRDWSNAVKFSLPDKDVFAINVSSLSETASYSGVGTTLFNMITNPVNGKIYVSNIEANNFARFEGPGVYAAGQTLQGNLAKTRITVISAGTVTPRHLNKHINYNTRPAPLATQQASLSMPLDMAISGDGSKLYVSAFGSSKVGVFNTATLENDTFNPTTESANYISVSGGGPAGLVLDEERGRLFVFTRFDNSISVVNPVTRAETQHIGMMNPEPVAVREGRKFLYDAVTTSSNGEASCASCHIFGDNDDLAWNLGNPDDDVKTTPVTVRAAVGATGFTPSVNGSGNTSEIHPMKGPMTTQTLRGMQHHGHMHWRADRVSGFYGSDAAATPPFDERLSFKNFIVAFEGLVGRSTTMPDADINKFADFALELVTPPNPVRNLDNSLTTNQARGKQFYMGCEGLDSTTGLNVLCSNGRPVGAGHNADGFPFVPGLGFTCEGCHRLDSTQGFFGTDGQMSFEFLPQTMKIPHLRNMYTKVGMFGMPQVPTQNAGDNGHKGDQVRGYGYLHDGSVDTVFRFIQGTQFNSSNGGRVGFTAGDPNAQRRDVEQFMLAFDNDIAPIVGQQITLTNTNSGVVGARIDLLKARAGTSFSSLLLGANVKECDLVAKGVVGGVARSWLWRTASSTFEPDDGTAGISDATLRGYANTAGQSITFTCVPPGSGVRIGLDRDGDDRANRLDSCPDNASCGASSCAAGTANCDGSDGNGCEANVNTSLTHCGGCNLGCDLANAAESCSAGVCTLGACTSGFVDCDGVVANGCELNTAIASCATAGLVTAGDDHACALIGNGKEYCWGSNGDGRIGDGTSTTRAAPTLVSTLTDVVQASAGSNFGCAVRSGGTVSCWGNDGFGQLGNGGGGSTMTPGTVSIVANAKSVSTNGGADSGYHACALQVSGATRDIACWGKGGDGQLGNGAFSDQQTRVLVSGISNAVSVAAGRNHSCAVLTNGQVKCWGRNDLGQLGNGTTTNSASPVTVLDLGDAARIAAGRDFTCAVRTNGRVKCWGSNGDGQLGDGSVVSRTTPVGVTGVTNANIVSLGDDHACAVLTDGTAKCWGRNAAGQLGNNTTTSSSVPVSVSGLTNLKDVAAGDEFSCAMKASTQEVFCWGANWSNHLGDGTTTQRNAPVSASGFPQIAPESNCLYSANGGHVYWVCDTQRTYADARSKCQALGFDLLVVNASTETTYVDGIIGTDYWAGYSDSVTEGSWKWVDNTTPGYPNWSPGEPNGGTGANCGSLQSNATMVDRGCNDSVRYVCEDPIP